MTAEAVADEHQVENVLRVWRSRLIRRPIATKPGAIVGHAHVDAGDVDHPTTIGSRVQEVADLAFAGSCSRPRQAITPVEPL